jgi:diamine N-acetyltransferase
MSQIDYLIGNEQLIDHIQPLWEELKKHHETKSLYFKHHYSQMTFTKRKEKLNAQATFRPIKIIIAKDLDRDIYIGYCISSIDDNKNGEIESLYVLPAYRKLGVGDSLMRQSLAWLDKNLVTSKKLIVGSGNEAVLEFYSRYGFRPRRIVLETP